MRFVYNAIYLLLLLFLTPWVAWRVGVQGKNREGWGSKLFGLVPPRKSSRRCVWIHAVSVGEVNLLIPLVCAFRRQFPNLEIAISTTTQTGFKLAKNRFAGDHVFYCPADFSWAVRNTLNRIKPDLLILTELELWPNLISITRSQEIPVALVNGRISQKSFNGYRRIGFLVKPFLRQLDVAVVQTTKYAQRLQSLGMNSERIHVSGNVKFDAVMINLDEMGKSKQLADLANLQDDAFVFIAGSTQENEDRIIVSVFLELQTQFPQLRLVLVPRHPDRCCRLAAFIRENGLSCELRSNLEKKNAIDTAAPILIVDVIGELGDWWRLADVGYVGGSMGNRGGQNMIEPAACGVPISFGPDTQNFSDVVELLLQEDAAVVIENKLQLKDFVIRVMKHRSAGLEMGARARQIVIAQKGAVERTLMILKPLLDQRKLHAIGSRQAA